MDYWIIPALLSVIVSAFLFSIWRFQGASRYQTKAMLAYIAFFIACIWGFYGLVIAVVEVVR